MEAFEQSSKVHDSFYLMTQNMVLNLQFLDLLSLISLISKITQNLIQFNSCIIIDIFQRVNIKSHQKREPTSNQMIFNFIILHYIPSSIIHDCFYFITNNNTNKILYFNKITDNNVIKESKDNIDNSGNNNNNATESNDNNNNSNDDNSSSNNNNNNNTITNNNNSNSSNNNAYTTNNSSSSSHNSDNNDNNNNNANRNSNNDSSNNNSDNANRNSNNDSSNNSDNSNHNVNNNSNNNSDNNNTNQDGNNNSNNNSDNNNKNNPNQDSDNNSNKSDYNNKKKSNKNSSEDEENFIDSKSRKSSVAIFFPSLMMSRMSDDLVKSSQEKHFHHTTSIDENLFSDHYLDSTRDRQIASSSNKHAHEPSSVNHQIVANTKPPENLNAQKQQDDEKVDHLDDNEDEFEKIFQAEINDEPIEMEECQNADEKALKSIKETNTTKYDFTLSFNNEILGDVHSLIDPNNALIVDEGSFTMDCIKISEKMNDALEIITSRRKEDLEPFSLKIKETTSFYKEKIECKQKKSKALMKSRLESIKSSHSSNLKTFKEKESIIHCKLTEIDSSVAKMSAKFEKVQSFLRDEIRKNKIFLEKKINELRESLKYAC